MEGIVLREESYFFELVTQFAFSGGIHKALVSLQFINAAFG